MTRSAGVNSAESAFEELNRLGIALEQRLGCRLAAYPLLRGRADLFLRQRKAVRSNTARVQTSIQPPNRPDGNRLQLSTHRERLRRAAALVGDVRSPAAEARAARRTFGACSTSDAVPVFPRLSLPSGSAPMLASTVSTPGRWHCTARPKKSPIAGRRT